MSNLTRQVKRTLKRVKFAYDARRGPLPAPQKWVFIVGCYNSGTTLLHDLLGSHPQIGTMPSEGQFLTDQLPTPMSLGLPRLWALAPERFSMDEETAGRVDLLRLKKQWGACYNDPRRPVLLEKTPTNAARTRWLQRHFENAHFIGIIRNGYAVVEGIHRKEGHSLEQGSQQWQRSNDIMLRDFEHLTHKLMVRYEDLTDTPDATLRDILAFLGLEGGNFSVTGRAWSIHEQTSAIQNMNPRSLKSLTEEEYRLIEGIAGDMLHRLGYLRAGVR